MDSTIPIEQQLQVLVSNMMAAREHLEVIHTEMGRLEKDGMYPAVPSEQWQERNGSGSYLYMLFRQDRDGGGYQGPDGKRKVYVGADPGKVAEARRMAANRQRWEELRNRAGALTGWISRMRLNIYGLVSESERYPRFDLGRKIAGQQAAESPK